MNSDAARVPVKWSPRNGCLIPLISRGFRFCPVSVAFNKLPSSVATSHEYTYVRGRSTLECWFSRGVHVEGTIFNFFESNPNVSSSVCSTMIEKRVQGSLFIYGELCEKELLKYINFFVIFILKYSIFDVNLVLNCICV